MIRAVDFARSRLIFVGQFSSCASKAGQVGGESLNRETAYMSKEEIGLSIKGYLWLPACCEDFRYCKYWQNCSRFLVICCDGVWDMKSNQEAPDSDFGMPSVSKSKEVPASVVVGSPVLLHLHPRVGKVSNGYTKS